jgi:polar amino acid transport system substrate-binding protein
LSKARRGDEVSRRGFIATGGAAAVGAASVLSGQMAQAQQAAPPQGAQVTAAEFAWGDGIRRIKSAGKMVFAMPGSMVPPQYYHDPATNEPVGYDAEVAKMIAKDLGVEAVFEEAVVAARVIGLQAGRYDAVMGGTANTPARAQSIAFTRGYVPYQQILLVRADSPITGLAELNDSKYTVTMQIGSTAEYAARQMFPQANIKPLQINEAMLEVASGRADADLVELYLAAPFAKKQPSVKILGTADKPVVTATEFGCLACRASDMALRQWLDNWLYWYDTHGILPALYDRIMGPVLR